MGAVTVTAMDCTALIQCHFTLVVADAQKIMIAADLASACRQTEFASSISTGCTLVSGLDLVLTVYERV